MSPTSTPAQDPDDGAAGDAVVCVAQACMSYRSAATGLECSTYVLECQVPEGTSLLVVLSVESGCEEVFQVSRDHLEQAAADISGHGVLAWTRQLIWQPCQVYWRGNVWQLDA